jgi:hypothetical protein
MDDITRFVISSILRYRGDDKRSSISKETPGLESKTGSLKAWSIATLSFNIRERGTPDHRTAIAYRGDVRFIRERILGTDMKMIAREFTSLVRVEGKGRRLFGQGGGETIQMLFGGDGYVIVHSKEEDPERTFFKRLKTAVKKLMP